MPEAHLIEHVYSLKTGELLEVKYHGTIQVAEDPYEAYARHLLPELEEFLREREQEKTQRDGDAVGA